LSGEKERGPAEYIYGNLAGFEITIPPEKNEKMPTLTAIVQAIGPLSADFNRVWVGIFPIADDEGLDKAIYPDHACFR